MTKNVVKGASERHPEDKKKKKGRGIQRESHNQKEDTKEDFLQQKSQILCDQSPHFPHLL